MKNSPLVIDKTYRYGIIINIDKNLRGDEKMNRYRIALSICIIGGPIMIGTQLLTGNSFSAAIPIGFATTMIMLVAIHLGLWAKSSPKASRQ